MDIELDAEGGTLVAIVLHFLTVKDGRLVPMGIGAPTAVRPVIMQT
jgi:hypothetical protein